MILSIIILFLVAGPRTLEGAKENGLFEGMLEFAESEFVDDQTNKFSDLAVDEALATDLDEQIYTIYERKHENPSPLANRAKYRIKSVDGQMPYGK